MIRKSIITICFMIQAVLIFAGDSIPSGAYSSLKEFNERTPGFRITFDIQRRTTGDIKTWGGNDYKVKSRELSGGVIRNELWGIQQGDTLYLNGLKLTGISGYCKGDVVGKYIVSHPAYPVQRDILKKMGLKNPYNPSAALFGGIGGAVEGARIALMRIPVIYDTTTDECKVLNQENVTAILESYPTLKEQFLKEPTPTDEETLIRYMKAVNEL